MGETIEITSWPKHQYIFYKVSSSTLWFDVKAPGNAVIGLASKPGNNCEYWVAIGDNNRCWIRKEDQHMTTVPTPNIISGNEYKRFWISWYGGIIQLGRDVETRPIMTHKHSAPNMSYITFSVMADRNPVHWKFELPPLRDIPTIRPITDGKLEWVPATNQLPDGALIGGHENETLYIIRAPHRGSLTPGKFVPSEGIGYVSWGGDSNDKNEFEVLCGFDCMWVPTYEDRIPVGAIEGGHSEDVTREILYVGRAFHNGHLIPGKVQCTHKKCYIPFEGKEIAKKRYEILVEPNRNTRCANAVFVPTLLSHPDSNADSDHEEDYEMEDWPRAIEESDSGDD